ncbi:bifunctional oligoribonuclease/PAP phosphatase NrnA [Longimicrobium sp.]|uniref:DHH family phosphoesterase n=1 Tax=Longimicrobium sp. TaxID=2029185 RepID=UPI002BC5A4C0|nr:bifunctional oligoribonuclease/PAP phosphatase NrnA [Longimicrobium sp.]HSU17173.1 bifunctional oligoribonuclease/PAP phosphatase NrnA [Longimicrobium sp.]
MQDAPVAEAHASPVVGLARLLESRRGERHVVAIQDFPDPDAISSAMAYRELAEVFGISADIVYDGQISHPENLALVNLLEIHLVRFDAEVDLERYAAAVFVDNQGTTTHLTERLKTAGVPTLAVIDHHDPQDYLDPIFSDVRPLGAAATILSEYLQSGVILKLEPTDESHVRLATALMHGLHSETDGFVRARPPEYQAAAYLSRFMDSDLLEKVLCVQKSHATLRVIEKALGGRTVRNGFSIAGVGSVRMSDRDAIPQAADFLLTEENVHTAIVYGLLAGDDGREAISGSLRTNKSTLRVDRFLKDALGEDLRGRPYGGGRSRAGGFEIDCGFLTGDEDDDEQQRLKWQLYDRRIRRKLFRAAGVEDLDYVLERASDAEEEDR